MPSQAPTGKFLCVFSLALMMVHASEAIAFQAGGVEFELTPGSIGASGVALEGLEVTQAIQAMSTSNLSINNSVPLIANKRTMVRAYFHTHSVGLTVALASGQLTATHTAYPGTTFTVNSTPASLVVDSIQSLSAKRNDLQKSLNFILDPELTVPGILTLRVFSLTAPNGATINCGLCRTISPELVTFRSSPPLRLRILGFNVQRNGTFFPQDYTLDFAAIRSWLERAYPIAQTQSAQPDDPFFFYNSDQIDADGTIWDLWEPGMENTCLRAIAKIRDIRNADLAANPNPPVHDEIFRTHYYGVLHDNGTTALANTGANYVEGCANYVPAFPDPPDPSTIGFGPTGPWSWGWDSDGSYGDWKAGHEIGHTLGRYHLESAGRNPPPSVPRNVCVIPTSYLDARPRSDGMVSLGFPNEPEYVGLDLGDSISLAAGGIFAPPRQPVPGDWNDVMAYCPYRWINQYTYEGIRERLEEENTCIEESETAVAPSTSPSPPLPSSGSRPPRSYDPNRVPPTPNPFPFPNRAVRIIKGDLLKVTGIMNFKTKKGQITAVTRAKETLIKPKVEESAVHVRITDIRGKVMDFPIAVQSGATHYSKRPTLGLIEKAVPFTPDIAKVELLLSGATMDARTKTQNAPIVNKLRLNTIGGQPTLALTWVATDDDPDDITTLTYTVQISSDSRKTWQTIAVGLTKPEFLIDPRRLQNLARVDFRVMASDGLNESKAAFATFCPKAKDMACSE